MARIKHAALPGCEPLPMRFKDVPLENGEGQPLSLCRRCEGSGQICTAEKKSFDKQGGAITERLTEFAGTFLRQRERGGWTVTRITCAECNGAGLICKGRSE